MIKCVIIDDEQPAIDVLKSYIKKLPGFELVGTSTNPLEGIDLVRSRMASVVFLDIQMDEMTGIDVMKALGQRVKVVFCTAYSQFAAASYELDAVDYLVKPIAFSRFVKAARKVAGIADIEMPGSGKVYGDYFYVKAEHKGKLIKIDVDEVDYVESKGNYVAFHNGEKVTMAYLTMRDLEVRLNPLLFARVHKSFIVSVSRIAAFENGSLLLKNGQVRIPVGESYKSSFMDSVKRRLML